MAWWQTMQERQEILDALFETEYGYVVGDGPWVRCENEEDARTKAREAGGTGHIRFVSRRHMWGDLREEAT